MIISAVDFLKPLMAGVLLATFTICPVEGSEVTVKENRLARETSPYLKQHAANPVDWYPWGDEALDRARKEDKPIFLSIGYSACHWCHVMAHESFEDDETAAYLNEHFISIKVDREERPDIDSLYMRAVNLMTGGGGWPLTVFLTPDLKPFYGGTYFPKEPRYGMPSFRQLLEGISSAFGTKRSEIEATGSRALNAVSQSFSPLPPGEIPGPEGAAGAAAAILRRYDVEEGGFGGGPKFPQPPLLGFLLDQGGADPKARGVEEVLYTLRKMEAGGIRDQVGGGFHRYSVDGRWLVPHFEKMLYDNAQLASLYFRALSLTGEKRFGDVGEEILEDLSESMGGVDGGFVAALDADSGGREGAYYVWSKDEWDEVLGKDSEWMGRLYGVTGEGNFEGENVLHRVLPFDEAAAPAGLDPDGFRLRLKENLRKLAARRESRPHPGVDTKILTDWNALAAQAHADAYMATGNESHLDRAGKVLDMIWTRSRRGEILHHVWDGKAARVNGFLADYAFTAMAEWRAFEADGRREHLERLEWLIPRMLVRFRDPESGLFYESPVSGTEDLLLRVRDTEDGVLPAAQSIAAGVLLRWERLTGSEAAEIALTGMLKAEAGVLKSHPGAAPLLAGIAAEKSRTPVEVVVSGSSRDAATLSILKAARLEAAPAWVVLPLYADLLPESISEKYPLFKGRRGDAAAAYVCVGGTCRLPITDPEKLGNELRRLKAGNKGKEGLSTDSTD